MLVPRSRRKLRGSHLQPLVLAGIPIHATLAAPLTPALGTWAEQNTPDPSWAGSRPVTGNQGTGSWCLDGEPGVGDWDAPPRGLPAPPIASCHLQSLTFTEHLLVLQTLSQTLHTLLDWALRCKQQKPTLAGLNRKELTGNISWLLTEPLNGLTTRFGATHLRITPKVVLPKWSSFGHCCRAGPDLEQAPLMLTGHCTEDAAQPLLFPKATAARGNAPRPGSPGQVRCATEPSLQERQMGLPPTQTQRAQERGRCWPQRKTGVHLRHALISVI